MEVGAIQFFKGGGGPGTENVKCFLQTGGLLYWKATRIGPLAPYITDSL